MSLADDLVKVNSLDRLYDLLEETRANIPALELQLKTLTHIESQLEIAIAIAAGVSKDTPVIPHIRGTVKQEVKTSVNVSNSADYLAWALQPGNVEGQKQLTAKPKKTEVEKYMNKYKALPPGIKYNVWTEYKVMKPKGVTQAKSNLNDRINIVNQSQN